MHGNMILCIYRSPSYTNAQDFINSLDKYLDLQRTQKNLIVTGDININIKLKNDEPPRERKNRTSYLDMLAAYGILPGHTLETREKHCLDHFMLKIDRIRFSAFIAILNTSITDHYTTLLSITNIYQNKTTPRSKTIIDYENALRILKEKIFLNCFMKMIPML